MVDLSFAQITGGCRTNDVLARSPSREKRERSQERGRIVWLQEGILTGVLGLLFVIRRQANPVESDKEVTETGYFGIKRPHSQTAGR